MLKISPHHMIFREELGARGCIADCGGTGAPNCTWQCLCGEAEEPRFSWRLREGTHVLLGQTLPHTCCRSEEHRCRIRDTPRLGEGTGLGESETQPSVQPLIFSEGSPSEQNKMELRDC